MKSDASSMAIFRSFKTLITKSSKTKTRPFFTATATSTTITTIPLYLTPPFYTHLHRPPFSKWIAPFQGPLFLSSPPWKLSQSATPLNGVVLRKVQALNLDLIRGGTNLPSKLGFGSGFPRPNVVERIEPKQEQEVLGKDGVVMSFVNLPNLVSISRLVSGPFIAWYYFYLDCIVVCENKILFFMLLLACLGRERNKW